MPEQREDLAARGHVPELDRPIIAGRREPTAVGAEEQAEDVAGMPDQGESDPPAGALQNHDRVAAEMDHCAFSGRRPGHEGAVGAGGARSVEVGIGT